jgi:hypothetical protein
LLLLLVKLMPTFFLFRSKCLYQSQHNFFLAGIQTGQTKGNFQIKCFSSFSSYMNDYEFTAIPTIYPYLHGDKSHPLFVSR